MLTSAVPSLLRVGIQRGRAGVCLCVCVMSSVLSIQESELPFIPRGRVLRQERGGVHFIRFLSMRGNMEL